MSPAVILYLAGLTLAFFGERVFAGDELLRPVLSAAGALALVAALVLLARGRSLLAERGVALKWAAVGVAGLVVYALTTDFAIETLGFADEMERRWSGVFGAVWPILVLMGTLPLLAVDHALLDSPVVVQPRRIQQAAHNGLAAALGIALVFPLNFLASEHNEKWDLTYFKTAEAGSATQNLVANLTEPLDVRVFLPSSAETFGELKAYFEPLDGPNFRVTFLDHAAEPRLTKALRVRDNGYVAITKGEIVLDDEGAAEDEDRPSPVTKTLKVGTELDDAKRVLKKLDEEVQELIIKVAKGDRYAYLTVGHGELSWKGKAGPLEKVSGLKKLLQAMNFKVKELGVADGLAEAVPDDADVVFVLGADEPFLEPEVAALRAYVEGGGSLFLALEPEFAKEASDLERAEDPMAALVEDLGLRMGEGVLAQDTKYVPLTRTKSDRLNLGTDRFSSHDSTRVLSQNSSQLFLFTPTAGFLEETKAGDATVTITVRSQSGAWADLDGDLEFDKEGENKKIRPLAAASLGAGETAHRAIVVADANLFSDFALQNLGNQRFVYDGVNWLIDESASSGETNTEEDVKIKHAKEDDTKVFYGTVLGIPLLLLGLGWARVRRRVRGGAA